MYNVRYKNNSLLLDIHDDRYKRYLNIFIFLSNTPHETFNKYVNIEFSFYEI